MFTRVYLILLVILFTLTIGYVYYVRFKPDVTDTFARFKAGGTDTFDRFKASDQMCPPLTFTCICGPESNEVDRSVTIRINRFLVSSLSRGHVKCYPSSTNPSEICERMSCELSPIQSGTVGGPVTVSRTYPIEISIPMEGYDNDSDDRHHDRSTRGAGSCLIKEMKHANITCWKWPDFVDCVINCSFAYALKTEEGSTTTRGISCMYDENRWWPQGFEECEAYLNCNAHLVSAGTLACRVPRTGPPYCEISCVDYDDVVEEKQGNKTTMYLCEDENFGSTLPHCARLDQYEQVLEKPNKAITPNYDINVKPPT